MKSMIVGSVAVAALVLASAFVVAPRSAQALPAYAQKEGKPCGYCHQSPTGGGPRTAKGDEYLANGHAFK